MIINESAGPGLEVCALEPTTLAAPPRAVVWRMHDPEHRSGLLARGVCPPARTGRTEQCLLREMQVREAVAA